MRENRPYTVSADAQSLGSVLLETVTCDQCGRETLREGCFWLTVAPVDVPTPVFGEAPEPDLCGWKCLERYAARRAGVNG